MGPKTGCAHIKLHTRKILLHSSKKRRPLWPVMMDDSAPTHKRRQLVRTYKNNYVPLKTVAAEVSGETYSKIKSDRNEEEKRPQT